MSPIVHGPPEWQNQIKERLMAKQAENEVYKDIIDQYRRLARTTRELKVRNRALAKSGGGPSSAEGSSALLSHLDAQLTSLRSELSTLYRTQAASQNKQLSMADALRDRDEEVKGLRDELRELRDQRDQAYRKDRDWEEKWRVRNKDMETLNDEVLSLNLELTSLAEQNQLLRIDNGNLLQRWIDKMNLTAEEMNNEFENEMKQNENAQHDALAEAQNDLHSQGEEQEDIMGPEKSVSVSDSTNSLGESTVGLDKGKSKLSSSKELKGKQRITITSSKTPPLKSSQTLKTPTSSSTTPVKTRSTPSSLTNTRTSKPTPTTTPNSTSTPTPSIRNRNVSTASNLNPSSSQIMREDISKSTTNGSSRGEEEKIEEENDDECRSAEMPNAHLILNNDQQLGQLSEDIQPEAEEWELLDSNDTNQSTQSVTPDKPNELVISDEDEEEKESWKEARDNV
ncbi:uncharacterized protein L201_000703 [Kwoniella dendrophila CBS 6074]|uniref:Autophagy-related protein 16 domain-containing protein n=1 Tax=Kwoniella dendrophila CBS 6074 TaxID=1295534 RepID=A0AAX4JLI6_9TREE